jgi:phosphoribosylformylglycinamidine cyclo-ligase
LGGCGGLTGAEDRRYPHPEARVLSQNPGLPVRVTVDYKQSGVDIDAGNEVVRRIRSLAKSTFTPGVLSEIGSFGGLFSLSSAAMRDPVLVASADGVGTKLRVAFMTGIHDTVGRDLVNHCVNDILVQGAIPVFFLDYLATGRLDPDVAVQIVQGLSVACRENGCALLGGETAEMPGFYADGEYDVAGFIVGAVEREHLIDGRTIGTGDVLIGLPSSGLHTNGYSLARRIAFDLAGLGVNDKIPELGTTLGDALLRPHRSYLPVIRPLLGTGLVKGMAHITGGGITDNLPRVLPEGRGAVIDRNAWQIPALFQWLQRQGGVPDEDMLRTFNMGIGLIVICGPSVADAVLDMLAGAGEPGARRIGEIQDGAGVRYR